LCSQVLQVILELLCYKHEVFALSDHKVYIVEHKIEMKEHQPVRTILFRLPYALKEELDAELSKLIITGCIEPSSGLYASRLVLVYTPP